MTSPATQIVQMKIQNPVASMPLYVPVAVICNTADEALEANVRANSSHALDWVVFEEPHDGVAVLVGGGPSLGDYIDDIRELWLDGATVFAINAAATFIRKYKIPVDYQVIADAKAETAQLVESMASHHLFASQVHPDTLASVDRPRLWHLEIGQIERWLPDKRVRDGGYVLIGGGAATGNSALCLAFAMGYRTFHIFGYDSCHREGESHAYDQPMNRFIPSVDVEWAGKTYHASVAMKAQAEKFQITGQALEQEGCKLNLYGEGLLQAMWQTPVGDLSERDKYQLLWQFDRYRVSSPGLKVLPLFLGWAEPDGLIIDFGCGCAKASIALAEAGHKVFLVDFADNCRDEEALNLPFLCWDLTYPCPISAPYGFCADFMEHIPPDDVETVIKNIMASADTVFFQISTVATDMGEIIGKTLHLTVKPLDWWHDLFVKLGFTVEMEMDRGAACCFLVK